MSIYLYIYTYSISIDTPLAARFFELQHLTGTGVGQHVLVVAPATAQKQAESLQCISATWQVVWLDGWMVGWSRWMSIEGKNLIRSGVSIVHVSTASICNSNVFELGT